MMEGPDLLLPIPMSDDAMATLDAQFTVHRLFAAPDPEVLLAEVAPRIRAIACGGHYHIGPELIDRLPQLEIIAGFGVGYDHIDAAYAETRGVIVTNTPDVLTEEVADTALGLLLMTVRELSAAERHLRAGKWPVAPYRLSSASLRDRTVGIAGMGRVGSAIARRLAAFGVPVVYYKRTPDPTTDLRFYDDLVAMAADVDILVSVLPGGDATRQVINRAVFDALGPGGILISLGRGSVVDQEELIRALAERRIHSAGLDVFDDEPNVPTALLALDNAVLLPHVGSGSERTRKAMADRVLDNLAAWSNGDNPISPVAETPFWGWRSKTQREARVL